MRTQPYRPPLTIGFRERELLPWSGQTRVQTVQTTCTEASG